MKRRIIGALIGIVTLAALANAVLAAGAFAVNWWSIDGGGGASNGGSYALRGTIGQTDAVVASGGSYVLYGGFHGGDLARYQVLVPLTQK